MKATKTVFVKEIGLHTFYVDKMANGEYWVSNDENFCGEFATQELAIAYVESKVKK